MRFLMMFFLSFVLFAGNVFASEPTSAEPVKSDGQVTVKENTDKTAEQGKISQEVDEVDGVVGVLSESAPEFKK